MRRALADEVGAQGDQDVDHRYPVLAGRLQQRLDERLSGVELIGGATKAEQLLELVDHDQNPIARRQPAFT